MQTTQAQHRKVGPGATEARLGASGEIYVYIFALRLNTLLCWELDSKIL